MDQRTRERLPVLPVLVRTADERRLAAARLLAAAQATESGAVIDGTDGALRKAVAPKAIGRLVWAEDVASGKRRNLSYEEEEAFWAFATIEVLRLTGIRCEELLELSHHSITEYRLPTIGELVPLLQIAPSKTDTERLLVSPELASVLASIVKRLRDDNNGAIPLEPRYDPQEKTTSPPLPHLFQRKIGWRPSVISAGQVKRMLTDAIARAGLHDVTGQPLHYTPHDFRRMFTTEAVTGGPPVHIAAKLLGHHSIVTVESYLAVFQDELIRTCSRSSRQ
jgi:integrase